MNNTKAIFIKQTQSLIKSPAMLVQAALFLIMVLVLSFLIGLDDTDCDDCVPAYVCTACEEKNPDRPNPSIGGLFTVMFVGMALMGSASALVQEDKTTNNLRFMTMAGMKPFQYLPGTGAALYIMSVGVIILFALVSRHFGVEMLWFVSVTAAGAFVSVLLGIAMGLSKIPVLTTPVSMILGMGPMLSSFNDSLARWLRFTYTQQVNIALSDISNGTGGEMASNFIIIGINGLVILLIFVWMHRKGELRW
jgi:hypothetical protein